MITLSLFLFVLSSITIIINSPVLLLFNILIIALTISWLTGAIFRSWYSFLVFLIYIGGIIVMFSYFVALSPNQYLKIKSVTIIIILAMLIISLPTFYSYNPTEFNNSNKFDSLYLYRPVLVPILLFIIILLLMIILIVVKIINTSKGPLRPFIYV